MCVIVHKPAGEPLGKSRMKRLWKRNPDGGGLAWIDPSTGVLETFKSLKWDDFWKKYQKVSTTIGQEADLLIHMRIATTGSVSYDNIHPFRIDDHTVIAHNGVFPDYSGKRHLAAALQEEWGVEDWSDTRMFIRDIIQELPSGWLDNPGLCRLVADYVGYGNKLMFLTNDPNLKYTVYLINESAGTKRGELWFSNSSGVDERKPYKSSVSKGGTSSYSKPASNEPKTLMMPPEGGGSEDSLAERHGTPVLTAQKRELLAAGFKDAGIDTELARVAITGTDDEVLRLMDRKDGLALVTPIIQVGDGEWMCANCQEYLDKMNYCRCWHSVCIDCSRFTAECSCASGIPASVIEYEDWKAMNEYMYGKTLASEMEPGEETSKLPKASKALVKTKSLHDMTDEEFAIAVGNSPA